MTTLSIHPYKTGQRLDISVRKGNSLAKYLVLDDPKIHSCLRSCITNYEIKLFEIFKNLIDKFRVVKRFIT
jgi:hypothetical protein